MIALLQGSYPWASGIWTGVIFAISGGLTIAGGKTGKSYLMIASMVFSIISAVMAGVLIILSSVILAIGAPYTYVYSSENRNMFEKNRLSYWKCV